MSGVGQHKYANADAWYETMYLDIRGARWTTEDLTRAANGELSNVGWPHPVVAKSALLRRSQQWETINGY